MMILRWWAVDIFVVGIGFFIFLMNHSSVAVDERISSKKGNKKFV